MDMPSDDRSDLCHLVEPKFIISLEWANQWDVKRRRKAKDTYGSKNKKVNKCNLLGGGTARLESTGQSIVFEQFCEAESGSSWMRDHLLNRSRIQSY